MNDSSWYKHMTSSVVNYAKQQFWHSCFSACSPLTHPAASSTCNGPETIQITLQTSSWFTKQSGLIQPIVATSHKQVTAYPTITQQLGLLSFRWDVELASLCWGPQAPKNLDPQRLRNRSRSLVISGSLTVRRVRRGNRIQMESTEKQLWKTALMTQREAATKTVISGIRPRQKLYTNIISFNSGTWLKVSGCLYNTASSTAPHIWVQATQASWICLKTVFEKAHHSIVVKYAVWASSTRNGNFMHMAFHGLAALDIHEELTIF